MEPLVALFLLAGALVGAFFLVVGLLAFMRWRRKQARRAAMLAAAAEHRFEFSEAHPVATVPFALRSKGDGGGAANFLTGSWKGTPVTAFDVWYYRNISENRTPLRTYKWFTCVATQIPAEWPHLVVTPESLATRVMDRTGIGGDLQFESEQFNRMFEVNLGIGPLATKALGITINVGRRFKGFDEALRLMTEKDPRIRAAVSTSTDDQRKFAYALIDARMMEWMIGGGGRYSYEILGGHLLCYTEQTSVLGPLFDRLVELKKRIPRAAWSLYPLGGPATVTPPPAPMGVPPPPQTPAAKAAWPPAAHLTPSSAAADAVSSATPQTSVPTGPPASMLAAAAAGAQQSAPETAAMDPGSPIAGLPVSIRPEELPLAPDDPRLAILAQHLSREDLRRAGFAVPSDEPFGPDDPAER